MRPILETMIPADIRSLKAQLKKQMDQILEKERIIAEEATEALKKKRIEELRRKFNDG